MNYNDLQDLHWITMIYKELQGFNDLQGFNEFWYTRNSRIYRIPGIARIYMIYKDSMIYNELFAFTMIYNELFGFTMIYKDSFIYNDLLWFTMIYNELQWLTGFTGFHEFQRFTWFDNIYLDLIDLATLLWISIIMQ